MLFSGVPGSCVRPSVQFNLNYFSPKALTMTSAHATATLHKNVSRMTKRVIIDDTPRHCFAINFKRCCDVNSFLEPIIV